jgi:hypothetical protein
MILLRQQQLPTAHLNRRGAPIPILDSSLHQQHAYTSVGIGIKPGVSLPGLLYPESGEEHFHPILNSS